MRPEDFNILRTVKSILVRNYVDTQKLDVDVINGTVYIEGELVVFEGPVNRRSDSQFERDLSTKRMLLQVEKEIRRATSVSSIQFKLKNWEKQGARWSRKRSTTPLR